MDDFSLWGAAMVVKSPAVRNATEAEYEQSTTTVPIDYVEAKENVAQSPTAENRERLRILEYGYKIQDIYAKGKAVFSCMTSKGYHKYEYSRPVDCYDPQKAIEDPALIVCYLTSIVGFGGLVPPNHPLWSKFDDKTLSIADYKKLKTKYGDEMRREAAKLLVAVRKGERVPIGTRIFLFDDSVTVDDFVMNKTQQYLTLRTTRKHTFRNGVSRHQFCTRPGFSNQLLFVNWGKGQSEVPFFGPLNNRVASLMWGASGALGPKRYNLFLQHQPADDDVLDFVLDKDQSFARAMGFWKDPELHATVGLLKILGTTFGTINLYAVSYFHWSQDEAEDWAAREWKRMPFFVANQPNKHARASIIRDEDLNRFTALGPGLSVFEQLYQLTYEDSQARPHDGPPLDLGIYDEDGIQAGVPFFDLANPLEDHEAGRLDTVIKDCITREINTEFLAQQRQPAIQLAQEHIVLFDRPDKAPKRVGEDLFAFRCVQELLQKALEAKWEDIKPQVYDALLQPGQVGTTPQEKSEFVDSIFPHLAWGFYTRLNPIFLGENSITSLWINEAMVAQLAKPNALAASQTLYEIVEEEQQATKSLVDKKLEEYKAILFPYLKTIRMRELETLRDDLWKQDQRLEEIRQRIDLIKKVEKLTTGEKKALGKKLLENEEKLLSSLGLREQ